jgi:FMN phosphatase YigB (HAD superfamily)
MDIRAVVFDLFGTLIDDSPPADYGTFLHETATMLGTDPERFTALWESQDVARYTGPIENCFESTTSARRSRFGSSDCEDCSCLVPMPFRRSRSWIGAASGSG